MKVFTRSLSIRLVQLAIIVLKMPFLLVGFGPEEDAWGHVYNIIEMYEEGHYIVSRLPGHPAYEALMFLLFPLIKFPYILNGLSALAGAFAIFEFYRLLLMMRAQYAVLWALAFGLFPAFFFGSTYTIDYAFTIWSMLRATRLLFQGRYLESGIFIGLATAFRITSLVVLLPSLFFMIRSRSSMLHYLFHAMAAVVVSVAFYSLTIATYGIDFFDYHKPPSSGFLKAFYKFLPGAWGAVGTVGILLLVFVLFKKFKELSILLRSPKLLFSTVVVVLFSLAYFRLPEKSAFTIPIYTYFLLIAASLQFEKSRYILLLLCISIFLGGIQFIHPYRGANPTKLAWRGDIGGQMIEFAPFKGLYFSELEKRKNKEKFGRCAFTQLSMVDDPKAAVITGWWYAQLRTIEWNHNTPLRLRIVYYLNEDELQALIESGYHIYHLEDLHQINDRLKNTRLNNQSKQIEINCL